MRQRAVPGASPRAATEDGQQPMPDRLKPRRGDWSIVSPSLLLCILIALSQCTGVLAQDDAVGPNGSDTIICENVTFENGSNGTNCTVIPCIQDACSTHVRREAYLACREFQGFDLTDAICLSWAEQAETDCKFYCSNCTALALTIYGKCIFYLNMKMPFKVAFSYCDAAKNSFEVNRCAAATVDKVKHCGTKQFEECNRMCGNYHEAPGADSEGCDCHADRAQFGKPDICVGETVNKGVIAGSMGLEHSCRLTPKDCMSHRYDTKCGLYTYCPVDVCVVKNITCEYRGDCRSEGVCDKRNGNCYYQDKPDGINCTDYLFWTHNDTCGGGECIGIEDKCMRYDVDCSTLNPCLEPRLLMTYMGVESDCDTGSGSCMYLHKPDGTPCSHRPDGEENGRCIEGVCRRWYPESCVVRNECPSLGECYFPSTCDNYTEKCVPHVKPDYTVCNDGRASTYRDVCIEGVCAGDRVKDPAFQILGQGDCVNHMPVLTTCKENCKEQVDGLPISRYFKDVREAWKCRRQCKLDPQCKAYSIGYHVCSIYGTERKTEDPPDGWQLQRTAAMINHEVTCYEKVDGLAFDFLRIVRQFLFHITVATFILTPLLFGLFIFRETIRDSYRKMSPEWLSDDTFEMDHGSPSKGSGAVAHSDDFDDWSMQLVGQDGERPRVDALGNYISEAETNPNMEFPAAAPAPRRRIP